MENLGTGADTAAWVAWHRTIETRRRDALFRDPLAAILAGDRGEQVARRMNRGSATRGAWTTIVRTVLIDELIARSLDDGVDRVVNLAAGYDTRPYRLALPGAVRWIEVDTPDVLDRKRDLLAGERPRCPLERCPADLRDEAQRARVLEQALDGASSALVISEGLLVYLPEDIVRALARDLSAHQLVRFWITDLASPLVRRGMRKKAHLVAPDARWRFAPADGADFFEALGWPATDIRAVLPEARRLKRLPWILRAVVAFDRNPRRPWGAVIRCQRR